MSRTSRAPSIRVPAYRQKIVRGKAAAVVTLTDAATRRRRDYWLGEWDSVESRERYSRLTTTWLTSGRRLPSEDVPDLAVVELLAEYRAWAAGYYVASEVTSIRLACLACCELFGRTPAAKFGPKSFRLVREAMIGKGWSRKFINHQCQRLRAAFRWGVAQGSIPGNVLVEIGAVKPLRRGKCEARETLPIKPVAPSDVEAIRPFVSRQVWALIELQRLTGARGKELRLLRKRDVDLSGEIWLARLGEHKTEHHGHNRTLHFGPQAKVVLGGFLMRAGDDDYLFSPAEAEAERRQVEHEARKTPGGQGNRPGTNRVKDPERRPGAFFTAGAYCGAIARACKRADAWLKGGRVIGNDDVLVKHWHPHQLRHAAATLIRKRFGLEAAAATLGHSSALITEAVYAERNQDQIDAVVRAMG